MDRARASARASARATGTLTVLVSAPGPASGLMSIQKSSPNLFVLASRRAMAEVYPETHFLSVSQIHWLSRKYHCEVIGLRKLVLPCYPLTRSIKDHDARNKLHTSFNLQQEYLGVITWVGT